MSGGADRQRLIEAVILGGVAVLAMLIALTLVLTASSSAPGLDRRGPVLPDLAGTTSEVRTLAVETRAARFELERDGEGWALAGRAGFPANADLAERILTSLAELEYAGARTASRNQHAALGLVAPDQGGDGIRITAHDYDGRLVADLILGAARGESGSYLRRPDEDQTWAVIGLPPVATEADRWMELDFLALGTDTIARVQVQPESGPTYRLERPGLSVRNFALRSPPGWRPVTDGAGNGTGSVLSRVRFRDVRRADFTDPPVARHTAETFGGLRVEIAVYADGQSRWATLRAVALSDDAQAEALALNNTADNWAFLLSDLTISRLIRPLDDFAIRPAPPAPQPDAEPR
ncbi:DUF4340 domain-containing protein [Hyphobacterium marinum]|uniref:DUF4340 domain-containing protein n=1 Tax=Hyphobacterium marinum TaxID=3116574 RepID=A0ABU7LVG4_9PROT|nr:DUF4340 domain-containing protein [Hyphobacterium sp. Y6023]MEE2565548.1 DUF4340 domain-containing protein [Hyphobacterium sp. Y6023]